MVDKEQVKNALEKVLDPEIGIDIVSLGLIYSIKVEKAIAKIKMTLTIPGCPLANYITQEAKHTVEEIDGIEEAEIELVYDPPWSPDMIPEETRKKLGLE
ncbi:metal-sulfur cluster assembly factor [bacterium]|nr:metal-sulfur cluster assembly factor [bacterium]